MNDKWYKTAIIYEIYPASFTEEGLQGVIHKLDYIKDLGVDAIWLCPIFASPFLDSGYDTSDYYSINDKFGTMSDFEELIDKASKKGIRVILDIALNHTSSKNHWFVDACSSKKSDYRDYYIFREGKNKGFPNNWISSKTMKPTWTYNESTDDYYLHIYTKYQPDLNWRNPKLREEAYKILKFWINKGVDGFRLDVINKIAKPIETTEIESTKKFADYLYENHADSHKFIKEMRKQVFDNYDDILVMGQTSGINTNQGIEYGKKENGELDLFLQFDHMDIDTRDIIKLKHSVLKWQNIDKESAWPAIFFGSHDSGRMINKYATNNKKYFEVAAKMLCALQLCLKGTQVIYMGDELAVSNVENKHIDEFIDIRSKDIYAARIKEGKDENRIISELNGITRDNARRQIPWDKAVEMQNAKDSVLSFYKHLINWRKNEKTILYGITKSIMDGDENVFAYQRVLDSDIISVFANISENEIKLDCSTYGKKIISNYKDSADDKLRPYEVKIFKEAGKE